MIRAFFLTLSILTAVALPAAACGEDARRPLRVDDLLSLDGYGPEVSGGAARIVIAPNGRALAFTRSRASTTLKSFPIGWNVPILRANTDVWVQPAAGQAAIALTHGETDGSGWWLPIWSPDSRYLAFLSTRGGGATLWLWSSEKSSVRQLTSRNLATLRTFPQAFMWLDERHILCSLLPQGSPTDEGRYANEIAWTAPAAWARRTRGELTASVLDSGVPIPPAAPEGDLVSIDIESGATHVITAGSVRDFQLSPTRNAVAFFRPTGAYGITADDVANQITAAETCALEIVDLQGRKLLAPAQAPDALPGSIRWSLDGRRLAFIAYDGRRDRPQRIGRVELSKGEVQWIALGDASTMPTVRDGVREAPGLEWSARGDLLVSAMTLGLDGRPRPDGRKDWWLLAQDGQRQSITGNMRAVPRQLSRDPTRASAMLGIASGEVWRFDVKTGAAQNLTEKLSAPVTRWIAPPTPASPHRFAIETGRRDYGVLDLDSGSVTSLMKPAAGATLSAYSAANGLAAYSERSEQGTYLWRQARDAQPEVLVSDTTLKGIAFGQFQRIEYRSLEGPQLEGWLLLPPDYQRGKRYPLLTWVYGGLVYGPALSPEALTSLDMPFTNMQLAAAQGYAVLFPSMPMGRGGTAGDPMLALTNGVLPAIEKAIDLGIADGERLFVGGHSYGGYSTYGLITQTNRFKAAVSMAGGSDLISSYGTFDVSRRYAEDPHVPHQEGKWEFAWAESGQGAMGTPPWRDTARYLRNSPLLSVERVRTPVLIVQGDLDQVAMEQGEEFFSALYRLGRRAQFVRYWGEMHNIESPANVRDLWARIFAWCDDFGDIARDEHGGLLWDGETVQSRHGQPARTPQQFLHLERFFAPHD